MPEPVKENSGFCILPKLDVPCNSHHIVVSVTWLVLVTGSILTAIHYRKSYRNIE